MNNGSEVCWVGHVLNHGSKEAEIASDRALISQGTFIAQTTGRDAWCLPVSFKRLLGGMARGWQQSSCHSKVLNRRIERSIHSIRIIAARKAKERHNCADCNFV